MFSARGVALNVTTASVQLRVLHNSVYLSARLKLRGTNYNRNSKVKIRFSCRLFLAGCLFSLLFNPENAGRIFLRNVGGLTSQKPVVYTLLFADNQIVFADSDGNLQRARNVLYILCNLQFNNL
jgi:hypothetical protein